MENQEDLDAFILSETKSLKQETVAEYNKFVDFFLEYSILASKIKKSSATPFEVVDDFTTSQKKILKYTRSGTGRINI